MPAPICRFHLNGVRARELEIPEKTGLSKNPLALKLRCTECLIIRVAKRPVIHTRRVELVKRRITVVTRISSTVASSAISSLWIGMLLPRSYAPTYEGLAEGRIHNSSIPKTVRRDRTAHVRKQRFSKTASFGPFGSFFPFQASHDDGDDSSVTSGGSSTAPVDGGESSEEDPYSSASLSSSCRCRCATHASACPSRVAKVRAR